MTESAEFKAGWDAPGVDPALLKAMVLIFVELMLVTAIALFFSTFSTPLLSAALTFGLYIVGHFNADLKNFEQVVDSTRRDWLARGRLLRAAGPLGVRRQDRRSSTACRCAAGYLASTAVYGVLYIAARAPARDVHLLAAGLQVTPAAATRHRGRGRRASSLRPRSPCRSSAIGSIRSTDRRHRAASCTCSPARRMERMALEFDALAADVYWIRAHSALRRRAAHQAPSRGNYELLYPLLDLTTTLDPYFTIAYRFGAIFLSEPFPGGPGVPIRRSAAAKGHEGRSRPSGSTTTTSASSITGTCRTTRPPPRGSSAPRSSRGAELAGAARGRDAQPAAIAHRRALWQQILQSDQEWLRRTPSAALQQLDALDQIDQLRARRAEQSAAGRRASTRGAWLISQRALPGSSARSTRHAVRDRPDDGQGQRVGVVGAAPMPENPERPPS